MDNFTLARLSRINVSGKMVKAMALYDYVIVGGGSSGCVVASRLAAETQARILLLEAGPRKGSRILDMPAGYMKFLARDTYLTMHRTVPQTQLDGRDLIIPQARVLGGGSAVNAMVYMRGQRADYDEWDDMLGNAGWSYRDLLPKLGPIAFAGASVVLLFAWAAWALARFGGLSPEVTHWLNTAHRAGLMLAAFDVLLPFSTFVSFDGRRVWDWNQAAWGVLAVAVLGLLLVGGYPLVVAAQQR